ncbi:MAG: nickel pincer cofactor biosynthesis protein LarC [Verrucomicrobia bacterium]|nr:MAG: nickel pincer cofactor biosynthesis protein LarC [Verrucomicrobiota bacterium]
MKRLYLDVFSGLSGDMLVGALLDLGVELRVLERELRRLPVSGYHLHAARAKKSDIEGTKFDVHLEGAGCGEDHGHSHPHDPGHGHSHEHGHAHEHRDHGAIRRLISESSLGDWVKEKSLAVFQRLAVAEGKIHGVPPDRVHFHEVGAVDSIVDIVGACVALDLLGRPRVASGPLVDGTGFVRCAHGRMPLPAPATLAVLGARGIGISQCEEPHELLTPTGAALLAEFAESFGPMRGVVGAKVGHGLGTRDNRTRPNVVRALLWEEAEVASEHDWETDTVAVLETNIDDLNPEILGHVLEKALRWGALDAFHTPVQMKKQRPGVVLTILCAADDADRFTELLLTETSAFGVRRSLAERRKLRREVVEVSTPFGKVKVKLGHLDGRTVQAAPEFESCRSVAAMAGVPLREVYEAAVAARR